MNFSQFVALRYLKANRDNRFFSWIAILSIAGIAISVAAMVVVLSVINGFKTELRDRFLHANAHILAYRHPAGMEDPERWEDVVNKDFGKDITGVAPFVHSQSMVRNGSVMQGVLVRGLSPRAREKVQKSGNLIQPPSALDTLQEEIDNFHQTKTVPAVPSVVVGSGLLRILNANVGDTIELVIPSEAADSSVRALKIIGTYDSGLKHYDNRILAISLSTAQKFFNLGTRVTGLEIGLKDPDRSPLLAQKMEDKYSIQIREWQEFNRPLFDAIQMERGVIFLIVSLTALVASFNILTTLFVSVTQKQRDVSILKSLGASNKQIVKLFINQGIYMGLIGAGIGLVLAFAISKLLERYKFIDLPDPYFLSNLPVNYDASVYAGIAALSVAGCIIAGIFPAYVAARVNPSEGFRGARNA